jgi:uncharacterized protein GlcG (DUF336 family)
MRPRFALPDMVAEILVATARAAALKLGVPMAVAVVDAEGGAQWFARQDGTLPISTDIAMNKAYTAAVIRMPTDELGRVAQPGAALYGIGNGHGGRIVLFGGGFPLCLDDRVVGGIGVSGGSVEQDMAVAKAALHQLAAMAEWAKRMPGLWLGETLPPQALAEVVAALRRALPELENASAGDAAAAIGGVALALS